MVEVVVVVMVVVVAAAAVVVVMVSIYMEMVWFGLVLLLHSIPSSDKNSAHGRATILITSFFNDKLYHIWGVYVYPYPPKKLKLFSS